MSEEEMGRLWLSLDRFLDTGQRVIAMLTARHAVRLSPRWLQDGEKKLAKTLQQLLCRLRQHALITSPLRRPRGVDFGRLSLSRCLLTLQHYCFITRRPEENDIFIIRLYAALILFWESFADCVCMRLGDCFHPIMCFQGIPTTSILSGPFSLALLT